VFTGRLRRLSFAPSTNCPLRALELPQESDLHIQGLMRKDIEHFADAMRARGLDPSSLHNRGLGGADGVLELTQWIVGVSLA
jgi:hypothetical protein